MKQRIIKKIKRIQRRYKNRWDQFRWPITRKLLGSGVQELIGAKVSCLFVHSSLSACGWIEGGADSVIDQLQSVAGTLCFPTYSYSYPASPEIEGPIFDPKTTKCDTGNIPEVFWRRQGVIRSVHPTHSIAAHGPDARSLCEGHERTSTPCGAGTPFEKLININVAVLMFGVSMKFYTLFHTTEAIAGCSYLYRRVPYKLRAIDEHGALYHIYMSRMDSTIPRRYQELESELEAENLLRRLNLGRGVMLYVPSAMQLHNYIMDKLAAEPLYLIAAGARPRLRAHWN